MMKRKQTATNFFCCLLASVGMASCIALLIYGNAWGMIPLSGFTFAFYVMCICAILPLFLRVMDLCCSPEMIVVSGNVKRLWTTTEKRGCSLGNTTTTYWALVTYRVDVVPNRHGEKGTDSLFGETEPSSIYLEDSGIEEDATAADDVPPPDSVFWKKIKIPAATFAECQADMTDPLPLKVLRDRPASAETADKKELGCSKDAVRVFAVCSVCAIAVGYPGVALLLDMFRGTADDDGDDDAIPWYIVAAYFALPIFCTVCCLARVVCASREPNYYGVLSSEEEDRITSTSVTTKKKTSGGEDETVETMSMATVSEIF